MKLNLPSIWTQEKITSLIFLTWLSANRANAGQAFRNCLAYQYEDTTIYNNLLNYPFASNSNITRGEVLSLCCANNNCFPCDPCDFGSRIDCIKVNSLIFCRMLSFLCQGIIGDFPITTNTILGGNCGSYSLASVTNHLNTLPASSFQGLKQGYALYYGCPSGSFCSGCNWDNGGWTCSALSANIDNDCFYQWTAPWPGLTDKNPLLGFVYDYNFPNSSSPYLTKKIAIPIGTTIGIGFGSGLTYYFLRKKRRKPVLTQATETNQQPVELLAFRDPTIQTDSSQPQITQQVVNPNQPRQVSINFTIPTWLNRIIS